MIVALHLASSFSEIVWSRLGKIYLEFVVPRLGKRIDAILLLDHTIFVVEFKVGESTFEQIGRASCRERVLVAV